jgi:hypothetical protein
MKQYIFAGVFALASAGVAAAQNGTPLGKFTLGTAGLSTAFGLSGNTLGLTFSGSYGPPRGIDATRYDASTALSLGLGNPVSGVGLQFDANLTSFRNFGVSGNFSASIHKMFQFNDKGIYSVMLSAGNLGAWGDAATLPENASVIGSYMFGIGPHPAVVTLGATTALNPNNDIEAIGSFGYSLNSDWAVSVGFAGDTPVVGATWQPAFLSNTPISISISDIDDEAQRKLSIDIGHTFSLTGN